MSKVELNLQNFFIFNTTYGNKEGEVRNFHVALITQLNLITLLGMPEDILLSSSVGFE